MDSFEVGDTVRLKSGGPLMTISWIDEDEVRCEWFVADELKSGLFQIASLEQSGDEPQADA